MAIKSPYYIKDNGADFQRLNEDEKKANIQVGIDRASQLLKELSPTVLTDANIRENVIPDINRTASRLLPQETGPKLEEVDEQDAFNTAYKKIIGGEDNVDNILASDPIAREAYNIQEKARQANDRLTDQYLGNITRTFTTLREDAKRELETQNKGLQNALMLGGTSRYAPVDESGILASKTKYDLGVLSDLQAKEDDAIANAQIARQERNYQFLNEQLKIISDIRKQKQAQAKEISDRMVKESQLRREREIQVSRDGAVADLVTQGMTNPADLLEALNGNGGDFTLKEINESLKNISPAGNWEGLSANLQDFFVLRDQGALPRDIASLSPDQQLGAWMQYTKKATGGGNKITLSDARAQNLPLSVVGMSEDELINDLRSTEFPQWFEEKVTNESPSRVTYLPETVQEMWDEYRAEFNASVESTSLEKKTDENKTRAVTYFKGAYGDAIDDETAENMAEYVLQYIAGGMSYADAVEQVIDDAS